MFSSLRPSIRLVAVVLAAVSAPAHAVPSAASLAAKGRIAPVSVQVTDPSLPPAARKAMTAKVEGLLGRALATPAFTDPHGFSLTRTVRIHAPQDALPRALPAVAQAIMIAQDIDLESGAKPDANGAYMGRLEGPGFHIHVNNLFALYANYAGGDPADLLYLPLRRGTVQGFPVFRVGVRDVVLVTKPGRQPWVNVTKGEYLEKQVADTRASIAQVGGTPHPKMQATLDRQSAELAALSPQDRREPACASSRLRQTFGDCADPSATFLVRANADYFDKGAPKTAVQLVAISTPAEGGHGHKRLEPVLRAAGAAIDYRAIQASLD